jgi:hypothetical protein
MTTQPSAPAVTKDCRVRSSERLGSHNKPVMLSAWDHFVDRSVPVSWS